MEPPTPRKRRYQLPSLIGVALFVTGVVIALTLILVESTARQSPAYLGVAYILPLLLILTGGVLLLIGWALPAKTDKPNRLRAAVDRFTLAAPLTAMALLVGGVVLVTVMLGVGSYRVYHVTESNEFCGEMCHQAMHPEFTAYRHTSHARVECVSCHVGNGPTWYMRAKFSGLRRLAAVITDDFARPIPTPIHSMRPARDTCETCHWPSRFIGYKEKVRTFFLSDKENTPHHLRLLMKIGGRKSDTVMGFGIHYHMLVAAKVEYIARDPRNQEIAWVRIQREDGSVTEYQDRSQPLSEQERAALDVKTMSCLDCHNRPAHQFSPPIDSVDEAMANGQIAATLPFIKAEAVRALSAKYATADEAMTGIASRLRDFYRKNLPETVEQDGAALRQAIEETQSIYKGSIFPEMKADWSRYPNNLGHRDWPGCFRCHNDKLESADGLTIFTACNKCHLILAQGKEVNKVSVDYQEGLKFYHTEDEDFIDEYTECTDCHTGGADLWD